MEVGILNQQFRPMDLGNILDVSWKIYKERFFTLVGIMAVSNLPITILSVLLGYTLENNNIEDTGSIAVVLFMILTILFLSITLYPLATGAGVKVAAEGFLDNDLSLSEAYKLSFQKYFALLVPMIFSFLAIGLGTIVGLIGFIIGSPLAYIFLTTIFIFITQSVMIDDKGYFDAMGRSAKLAMTDFWRVLGIGIVILFITMFSGIIINLPGLLPYLVLGESSIVGQLFYNIFSFLSGILIGPYTLTVITVLYFDLKIRKEDFGKVNLEESKEEAKNFEEDHPIGE